MSEPGAVDATRRTTRLGSAREPLVGRDDELARLRAARTGGRAGVVLSAAPGMGRTAVLAEFVDWCRERRDDVVLVRASATSRRLRFAALTPLLDHHFATGSTAIDVTGGPITFDLVRDLLRARAAASPFVLAIDDAQLLDEGSLRVIADAVGPAGPFVVVTVDHTFRGLDPLTEHPLLDTVELGPLSPAAVAEMVADHPGRDAADTAGWWARSSGNPTVLQALLRDDHPERDLAIPGGLSPAARRLLSVIAMAESLPVDRAGADEAVAELLARGTIALSSPADGSSEPGALHLRHAAQGSDIRHALGPIEARSARRAALEALRDTWPTATGPGRLQLAALALESGVPLRDDELLDVVALAPAAGDARLALRLARTGVEQLGRFDDLRRLADVAHEQGEVDDVEEAIARMADRAVTLDEHAAVAVARSQHLLWRRADGGGAVAALDGSPAIALAEVQAVRARLLATIGQAAVAVSAAGGLRQHDSPRVRMQAALAVAHGLRRLGEPTRAVAVLDDAIATAAVVDDPVLTVSAQVLRVGRLLAMCEAGRWSDAAAQSTSVVSYAERYDEAPGRAVALLVQGVVTLEAGAPAAAMSMLDGAVELFTDLAQPGGLRWALSATALAHGLSGDAVGVRRLLDELGALGPHPADLFPSLEPRARAWGKVTDGDPEGARAVLRAAVAAFRDQGALGPAGQCAHDLLSLDDAEPMIALPPLPGEPLHALRQRHAAALHARDAAELALLTDDFERLGGYRWAAECAAALSHAVTRAGNRDAARRAVDRLAGLRTRCTGLDVPALSAGRMITLSAREREIALLAARGLTSKAIGERLGLSVRTVDNHLSRCFDKLGTRNRSELAELLLD